MHTIQTTRRLTVPSARATVLCGLFLASLMVVRASAAEPRPSPHRFIPAKSLIAYVEFDGLDAHADAWKATAAHGLLVKTPAGSMMTELAKQVLDRLFKMVPEGKVAGADLIALHDHLMQRGFVIAVHDVAGGKSPYILVLNGFGEKPIRERMQRLLQLVFGTPQTTKLPAPIRLRGRDVYQLTDDGEKSLEGVLPDPTEPARPAAPGSPWLSWWYDGDDLVLIAGPTADLEVMFDPDPEKKKSLTAAHAGHRAAVLDVIDGKQPNVATHAAYVSALAEGKDIKGFEPDGLFFVDSGSIKGLFAGMGESPEALASLGLGAGLVPGGEGAKNLPPGVPEPPKEDQDATKPAPVAVAKDQPDPAAILGLDGIKRIVGRWGFQGKALFTDVRVEAPAPRKGLVAWLDQPHFRKDGLPPIPRGTSAFAVDSFDPAASYQKILGALKALEPEVDGEIGQFERAIREATGLRFREDLLNQLGPTWSVFRLPSLDRKRGDDAEFDPAEYALLAGVHDAGACGKVLDSIASRVNQYLRDSDNGDNKDQQVKKEADLPILALTRLPAPDRGYQLTSPARLVPWLELDGIRPTILVGKSFVACASNLERAREALAAESQAGTSWKPGGELVQAFECLPERLTFLTVGDHRDSPWPDAIAQLPGTIQTLSSVFGDVVEVDSPTAGNLLGALGIPRPGGFRVRIDPSRIPKAEQLRPYLFPSVLAATVDDRGFRVIGREAFPLACYGNAAGLKYSTEWTKAQGFDQKIKLKLGLGD
jgi:hypothetical protein